MQEAQQVKSLLRRRNGKLYGALLLCRLPFFTNLSCTILMFRFLEIRFSFHTPCLFSVASPFSLLISSLVSC